MKDIIKEENTYESNVKIIADNVKKLSEDVRKILNSGLTEEAVIILIAHSTGLTKTVVRDVVGAITKLDKRYTQ